MSTTPLKISTHRSAFVEPLTIRRGSFWIPGELASGPMGPVQVAPMYVEWEAIPDVTAVPIVLVHGGGGQGTDWKTTPDGRPGWADRLVRAGHPVYVVDRPGHGRSPAHPDVVGPLGAPGGYGSTSFVFVPPEAEAHTQWPWGRTPGTPELEQLVASAGFLPADIAIGQRRDADRLTRLLDEVGPAIVIAHSAGAPATWLVGMERPDLVAGILALEPMGPPYATIPGIGELVHGLTATAPSVGIVSGLDALRSVPIGILTGHTSVFVPAGHAISAYLAEQGIDADSIDLPSLGITGNGHGMFFEANSDEVLAVVRSWIDQLPDQVR